MNAVYILWLRQLKRYFRSRARMIGSLGQPALFLVALGFGLGPTFARAGRGDYVQFLAPGIVFLVCLAAGFRPAQPLLLPLALLLMALIAIMCTAIGTAVGTK